MSEGRVSCDGRATGEEHLKKFVKVDNFIVAFAGETRALEFIDAAGLFMPNDGNFKTLAEAVQRRLETEPYRSWNIYLGMGGVNSGGLIEFYTMGTGTIKQRHFMPKGDQIDFAFFYLNEYGMDLKAALIKYLRQTGFNTPPQVLRAQKLLNDSFADINPTMNKNTFPAVVLRQQRSPRPRA